LTYLLKFDIIKTTFFRCALRGLDNREVAAMRPTSTPPDTTVDVAPFQGWRSNNTEVTEVQRLVRQAQAGDQEAFGKLYRQYYSVVFGAILKRVGHWHLAEDLASETFLKAWRRITSFTGRGPGGYLSWLLAIASNSVRDYVTSPSSKREKIVSSLEEYDYEDSGLENSPEAAALSTVDIAATRATIAAMRAAIEQLLSQEQRQCIESRFLNGHSLEEIAKEMGRNTLAISSLQYRALRKLARYLGENEAIRGVPPDP
jgi:RNA polymerase sigma-70 factor (ECF subfamily)